MDTDNQNEKRLGLSEWVKWFEDNEGIHYNLRTLGKRRQIANLGTLVGPRKRYVLTKDEFNRVARTPLPYCSTVIPGEIMIPKDPTPVQA